MLLLVVGLMVGTRLWQVAQRILPQTKTPAVLSMNRIFAEKLCAVEQVRDVGRGQG